MSNTIYAVLGVLAVVYFAILFSNKRSNRQRRSRGFLEGKRRQKE